MTGIYGVRENLPGYTVVGLRVGTFHRHGWEAAVLHHPYRPAGKRAPGAVSVFGRPRSDQPDARFSKKVKWYVKPIMFGGDASAKENMIWVTYEQHAELVRWWAKMYRDHSPQNQKG